MRPPLAVLLVLAGCTAGSGDLAEDAGLSSADWVEVELATGLVSALDEPDGRSLARPRWRTSHVLFRRVPRGEAGGDTRLLPGGGEPEDAATYLSDGRAFLAVFELTIAQWAAMHGGASDDLRPITGVAPEDAAIAIAAQPVQQFRLDLPDPALWAVGCAGGRQALFSWGDGLALEAAATYAVHHPRSGSAPVGPAAAGSLLPNGLGCYDMHGNVWEMVRRADGTYEARGGAWDSPAMQCRTANAVDLPAELAVPNVGLRLALRP